MMDADIKTQLELVLQRYWGYPTLREGQDEVILNILSGKDTLVLLPTGGGKSLCYQLPALFFEGITLVVTPLLALMKDQVSQLYKKGIPATFLSSDLDDIQEDLVFEKCKNSEIKILYVSPERLKNRKFLENIQEVKLSLLAVDEAHCISEWGNDFRPSYQNIINFRREFPYLSCVALTATASDKICDEIITKLGLKNPFVYKKSFRRNNIHIQIKKVSDKKNFLHYWLKNNPQSGLIYTRTRRETEDLVDWLQRENITNVDFYHAGLSSKEKYAKQQNWTSSRSLALITTNAFGMGIDKEDVNFVIHYSPPASLENYYQEIGRAGRNGEDANAILLWNEEELSKIDELIFSQIPSDNEYQKLVSTTYSLAQIAENELSDRMFELSREKIQKITNQSFGKIQNVLNFLHIQEVIYLKDKSVFSSVELKISISDLDHLPKKDAYFVELLLRYLPGIGEQKVSFNRIQLENKTGIEQHLFTERLKELHQKEIIDFFDGTQFGIKFLHPRNSIDLNGKYKRLFKTIQTNKLQKWEEMKYFLKENNYCRMKMILKYFGEDISSNCNNCDYCLQNRKLSDGIPEKIMKTLLISPMPLDEITIRLQFYPKELIFETLKDLLEKGRVKMLNYKTYMLNE